NKGRKSDITFAMRKGVVIREATTQEEFDEYYRIYVQWSQRKGLEIQSLETMRTALALRSNRRLFLALHEEKVVAGSIMRYVPGGIAEYSANSSIDEALALKPNALLVWSGIQWACAEGLRKFSMGAAHPFLRHFGGTVVPLYRYRRDQTVLRRYDVSEWAIGTLRRIKSSLMNRGVTEKKRI
ncbi:MAG TPA: GNAT family N-acetyltransferase, partial [Terriglobales bacterium]